MRERVLVLPVADNDRVSLAREVAAIRREILALAGGYSEVRQVGAWLGDDGRVYHDKAIRLTTTVDETQDASIVARLPAWAGLLRQECLYTHVSEVQADFVHPVSQESLTAR